MDKVIEKIWADQIPFDTLERTMGIPSSVFLAASNAEEIVDALTNLTNGRSTLTPMIDLKEYNLGYRYARFSLYRADGKYHLRVHPVRDQEEFDNEFGLSNEQIEALYRGEKVLAMADPLCRGFKSQCLIQLIPDTNAQVCCPCDSIMLPRELGGQMLTDEMRQTLTSGQKLTLLMDDNQAIDVEIDLVSPNVLKVQNNNDRLLRSATTNGQSQEAMGLGSVLSGPKPTTSKSKGKTKTKGGQAGAALAPQASQTQAQSEQSSASQSTKKSGGVKR